MILKVPAGTVVKDAETGKVILDMANRTEPVVLLKGGRGGKGNQHYATATMQAPKYAQPGQRAKELWVDLELKVIADVGLIGFPNVGKSTFLSRVTNAKPKIANYHFTTLNPNLGVVDLAEGNGFVIADIPGIIEGASEGVGLGYQFLRHIERTKVMIHLVDAASVEGRDPIEDIIAINKELEAYNPELAKRPQVIAANKMDAMPEEDREVIIEMLEEAFADKDMKIFPISAVSGQGVKELLWYVNDLLKECGYSTKSNNKSIYSDFREIIKTELINKGYAACNVDIFVVRPTDMFCLQLSYNNNIFFTDDNFVQITVSEYEQLCSSTKKINKSVLFGIYLFIKQYIMDYKDTICPAKISFPSKAQIAKGLSTSIQTVENGLNILESMKMIYTRRDMFVENKKVEGQYVPTRNVFALDPKELEGRSVLIELERIYGRRIYDKEDVPGEINYLIKLKEE